MFTAFSCCTYEIKPARFNTLEEAKAYKTSIGGANHIVSDDGHEWAASHDLGAWFEIPLGSCTKVIWP